MCGVLSIAPPGQEPWTHAGSISVLIRGSSRVAWLRKWEPRFTLLRSRLPRIPPSPCSRKPVLFPVKKRAVPCHRFLRQSPSENGPHRPRPWPTQWPIKVNAPSRILTANYTEKWRMRRRIRRWRWRVRTRASARMAMSICWGRNPPVAVAATARTAAPAPAPLSRRSNFPQAHCEYSKTHSFTTQTSLLIWVTIFTRTPGNLLSPCHTNHVGYVDPAKNHPNMSTQ